MKHQCIYLHGFASGPASTKAMFFSSQLRKLGLTVHVPDLNGSSFSDLTLTSQLDIVRRTAEVIPSDADLVLVGSSMGGLIATLYAQQSERVKALVLLAPGFGLSRRWHQMLKPEEFAYWRIDGTLDVYNYAVDRKLPLKYSFVEDAESYRTDDLVINVPALVLHGINDDVVPIIESEAFARTNTKWVDFHQLNSDHDLTDCIETVWTLSEKFLEQHGIVHAIKDCR